jgi:hypothetical protein
MFLLFAGLCFFLLPWPSPMFCCVGSEISIPLFYGLAVISIEVDLELEVMGSSQYNINGFLHFWAGDHHCFTKSSN